MKLHKKNAFTLAEVLITLGVIGIVAVILMGIIGSIIPSREKVMFKKAYNNLEQITEALVNNADYYGGDDTYPESGKGPGDLSYLGSGYTSISEKFCTLAADMVDTNSTSCGSKTFTGTDGVVWTFSDNGSTITCTFDVNGAKAGGTYSASISSDGVISTGGDSNSILSSPYQNR